MGDVILDKEHSLLSPSASPRWMRCPGSVWLCQQAPKRPVSVFAEEGTVAHHVAEDCLSNLNNPSAYLGEQITSPAGMSFTVTQEMVDALDIYVDAVRSVADYRPGSFFVEKRFDLYDGLCSGTADAVVVGEGAVYVFRVYVSSFVHFGKEISDPLVGC